MRSAGYYLEQAQFAVAYVKSKMVDGADNHIWDIFTSGLDSRSCVPEMRDSYRTDFYNRQPAAERIKVAAMWAEASGCGNCGEQAAIAYQWLLRNSVLPVEFMQFAKPKDHNFVVLGRIASSDVAQPATWGPDAVICDPWKNRSYLAIMLNQIWPGCTPELVVGVPLPPLQKTVTGTR